MLFALQTSLFYQLFIFTTLVWFALWVYRRREFRKLASQIPDNRFRYYPLVGHAYKFFGDGEDRMETFKMVAMDAINAGGVIKFWMATRLFLVIADPVLAETIAKTCLQKDELMELIQELTGDGLIFAKASIWRPRRRVLAPVFRRRHLAPFVKVFAQESRLLASRLNDRCQRGDFSLWNYLTTYTMDSVCKTDLGVHVGAQNSPFHPFLVNFETFARGVSTRIVNVWMHSPLVYWFTPLYRDMRDAVLFLHEFVDKIIANKRKELEKENNKYEVSNGEMKNASNDKELPFRTFLELIMSTQEGSQYSDKVLREETLVIALAGTDTSAVGACFTLCLLARYPEVQEKVYEELREVFEDSDRPITNEDYPRLRYLEAVCKESLRLYPPVPVIARKAESYVTLPTGVTVVPGTSILINIWGVHHNPQYWGADAEQFRPERFLEPLAYPNAYMPFSCGPRNCLGYQYAMMSLKAGVAAVVRRYRALPPAAARPPPRYSEPHGFRLKFDIMMKDVNDFQLRLERRVH